MVVTPSGLGKAVDSVLGLEEDLEARVPPLCSPCRSCAYAKVTFRDLAAGLLLEMAKTKVAEVGKGIDKMAAQQIK